jgi:hypothetical protein
LSAIWLKCGDFLSLLIFRRRYLYFIKETE